ncbi:MAG: hypothetical protein AVDCRST_MAG52-223, partial [uncultured Blastococcus sp.]
GPSPSAEHRRPRRHRRPGPARSGAAGGRPARVRRRAGRLGEDHPRRAARERARDGRRPGPLRRPLRGLDPDRRVVATAGGGAATACRGPSRVLSPLRLVDPVVPSGGDRRPGAGGAAGRGHREQPPLAGPVDDPAGLGAGAPGPAPGPGAGPGRRPSGARVAALAVDRGRRVRTRGHPRPRRSAPGRGTRSARVDRSAPGL